MDDAKLKELLDRVDALDKRYAEVEEENKQLKAKAEEAEAARKKAEEDKATAEATAKAFAENSGNKDDLARILKQVHETDAAKRAREYADETARVKRIAEADREARLAAERERDEAVAAQTKLLSEARNLRIGEVAKSCRVPAVRPFIEAFLALADASPNEKVYALDGKTQVKPAELAAAFISSINEQAKTLFVVHSADDPDAINREPDSGKEVDRLTKKYMHDHPEVTNYTEAMKIVLNNDPELKQRYATR